MYDFLEMSGVFVAFPDMTTLWKVIFKDKPGKGKIGFLQRKHPTTVGIQILSCSIRWSL